MTDPGVRLAELGAELKLFAASMQGLADAAANTGERSALGAMASEARTFELELRHVDPNKQHGAGLGSLDNLRSVLVTVVNMADPRLRTPTQHSSDALANLAGDEERLQKAIRAARMALGL